ncbi:hypothetical protein FJT64_013123 [Amphibalanus amphitrite]|uniref:Uncharacterized protein n=1 Tax=Amphibalanus amphitrite TaxID=1232801 RepID=A0A6A4VB47_AMPAM|nr:hypothetical protein FJT64_013123 [Amphibalanus amphitrite]
MNKVAEVERLLEDAAAGKTLKELYGRDVDVKRLEVQLKMLPDIMTQANSVASVAETNNSSAISVHSVCQALQKAKKTGGELYQKFLPKFVLPFTQYTLTIHRHRTDQLDVDAILDEFVSANERHRLFFGKQ